MGRCGATGRRLFPCSLSPVAARRAVENPRLRFGLAATPSRCTAHTNPKRKRGTPRGTRHDVAHFRSPPERGRTRSPSSGAPGRRPGRPAGRSGALAHPPQGPRRPRQGRPAIRLHRRGGRRGGGKAPRRQAPFSQSGPIRRGAVCRAASGDAAAAAPPGRRRFRTGRFGGGVVPGGTGLSAAGAGARPGGARPHPRRPRLRRRRPIRPREQLSIRRRRGRHLQRWQVDLSQQRPRRAPRAAIVRRPQGQAVGAVRRSAASRQQPPPGRGQGACADASRRWAAKCTSPVASRTWIWRTAGCAA